MSSFNEDSLCLESCPPFGDMEEASPPHTCLSRKGRGLDHFIFLSEIVLEQASLCKKKKMHIADTDITAGEQQEGYDMAC